MDVKVYRAKTMQEALAMVRRELGPKASVLHTRDVRRGGLLGWIAGSRGIEVQASAQVTVPSRLPPSMNVKPRATPQPPAVEAAPISPAPSSFGGLAARGVTGQGRAASTPAEEAERTKFHDELRGQISDLQSMVEDLCRRSENSRRTELPPSLFSVYTRLIDAEVGEELARELIDRLRKECSGAVLADPELAASNIARIIEGDFSVSGPIQVQPGQRRIVALVGPTGVGKTTTIAKLAANFRFKEKRRVGLITVDTYRIAAVEQLRTYAEIIELPMEVVSSARDMRAAITRMADLDLVLLDTAGRSPRDEIRIQELKSMLNEATVDETHLVLSSVASASVLSRTAEQFSTVGVDSLILTKLDEAAGLGNVLSLLRTSKLPLSYVTNGQNVPDDIRPADRRRIAASILGMEPVEDQ